MDPQTYSDDVLDRQLREAVPYIDDNGFSARVMSQLPAPQQKPVSLRNFILLGVTILGSALSYTLSDAGHLITSGMIRAASLPMLWILLGVAASGMLLTIAGATAAVVKSRNWQS